MRQFVCQNCDKTFSPRYKITKSYTPRFCSLECKGEKRSAQNGSLWRKCRECQVEKPRDEGFERTKTGHYRLVCRPCRADYMRNKNIIFREQFGVSYHTFAKGLCAENFIRDLHRVAKRRAYDKRRQFELSFDFLLDLWTKQEGKCALSGVPMTFIVGKKKVPTNITIDRINSSVGYIPGNVHLVCYIANIMKNVLTMEEFYLWCSRIVEVQKR